jgi:threonine dehydratase
MNTFTNLSLQAVVAARQRLAGAVSVTPCTESIGLSQLTGSRIFCKREYLQRTGSFKERGACNALSLLASQRATGGVIAASAGNHALGLAWHARAFELPVTVVMPRNAPQVKISKCRGLGARVVLDGDSYEEARTHASELGQQEQLHFSHPIDDLAVMAGQGTLALEIIEQVPDLDVVLVQVGGGGLLAGIATVFQALKPSVTIIGVEPENAACFSGALRKGRPVRVVTRKTLADGLAVAEVGARSFAIAASLVDRVVTVREDQVAQAIVRLEQIEHAVVEGAGAIGLAALLGGVIPLASNQRVVLLLTGGNIDPMAHRRVLAQAASALKLSGWPNGKMSFAGRRNCFRPDP